MNRRVRASALTAALVLGSVVPQAQTAKGIRTSWGEPDLGGVWKLAEPLGARPGRDTYNLAALERLYRPEARKGISAKDDPALRCRPSAFPRAATMGAAIQVVQSPGLVHVFTEAFPTYRIIPTDGKRRLTADYLVPYFMGNSAAHWEGDTLVVDVISLNSESWLAGNEDKPAASSPGVWPTSDERLVTERWRRVDADTLEYQARVEDKPMLTGPWDTPRMALKKQTVDRIDEALCLERDGGETYLERFGFRRK